MNVTDKSDKKKAELEKYLTDMSENRKFLDTNDSKLADKFKDILKEILIEDKLHKDYEAEILEKDGNAKFSKAGGFIFSYPPKVNWTLNAEDIKNAFEKDKPLKLVYKLKPKKDVGTADITLAESTAKYKINDNSQKSEAAGKLLLKLQDVIIESNVVDETEDTQSGSSGSYPNGKDLTTVEDTKPEGNKKENNNKENNKEDNKQKPNDVNKNQKAKAHKEKSSKIPKTAIAGSSTLLLTVGLLGMYISKRRNGK